MRGRHGLARHEADRSPSVVMLDVQRVEAVVVVVDRSDLVAPAAPQDAKGEDHDEGCRNDEEDDDEPHGPIQPDRGRVAALGAQAEVGTHRVGELDAPRVRLVTRGQHRVDDTPVGGDVGVIPSEA